MEHLLAAASAMPAAIFTTLLIVAVVYWLGVALGTLDIDLLHVDIGDAHAGGDTDVPANGFLEFLSLGRVPLTVLLTLFTVWAWLLAMIGELALRPALATALPGWSISLGLGVGASAAALMGAAVAARLLRPVFTVTQATRLAHLVGRQAVITSLTVDARFGTAVCTIDGDDIILNVVIRDDRRLVKGDHAVVVDYDEDAQVHLVAPLRHPVITDEPAQGTLPPPLRPPQAIAPSALPPSQSAAPSSSATAPRRQTEA